MVRGPGTASYLAGMLLVAKTKVKLVQSAKIKQYRAPEGAQLGLNKTNKLLGLGLTCDARMHTVGLASVLICAYCALSGRRDWQQQHIWFECTAWPWQLSKALLWIRGANYSKLAVVADTA